MLLLLTLLCGKAGADESIDSRVDANARAVDANARAVERLTEVVSQLSQERSSGAVSRAVLTTGEVRVPTGERVDQLAYELGEAKAKLAAQDARIDELSATVARLSPASGGLSMGVPGEAPAMVARSSPVSGGPPMDVPGEAPGTTVARRLQEAATSQPHSLITTEGMTMDTLSKVRKEIKDGRVDAPPALPPSPPPPLPPPRPVATPGRRLQSSSNGNSSSSGNFVNELSITGSNAVVSWNSHTPGLTSFNCTGVGDGGLTCSGEIRATAFVTTGDSGNPESIDSQLDAIRQFVGMVPPSSPPSMPPPLSPLQSISLASLWGSATHTGFGYDTPIVSGELIQLNPLNSNIGTVTWTLPSTLAQCHDFTARFIDDYTCTHDPQRTEDGVSVVVSVDGAALWSGDVHYEEVNVSFSISPPAQVSQLAMSVDIRADNFCDHFKIYDAALLCV